MGLCLADMARRILDHNNVQYEIVVNRHVKFYIKNAGELRVISTSKTPSDHKSILNFYTKMKHTLIELGVDFKADSKRLIHN